MNPFGYCQSNRGGTGTCSTDESCYDFEEVYWNRFDDSVAEINNPKILFHPTFLDRLKQYNGIRFMKWSSNHGSYLVNWSDRAQLRKNTFADDAEYNDNKTKTTRGVPYEIYNALGNVLNADIYLTMPAKSSDDFNTQYAKMVASELNSNLKVYLEYSNEVWNRDYALDQQHMLDQATARGITGGDSDFLTNGLRIAKAYSEAYC